MGITRSCSDRGRDAASLLRHTAFRFALSDGEVDMNPVKFNRLQLFRNKPGDAGVPDMPLPVHEPCYERAKTALLHQFNSEPHWHARPSYGRLIRHDGSEIATIRVTGPETVEFAR